MKILVDADACPITGMVERIAREAEVSLLIFCDTNHIIESEYGEVIVVGQGADAVDFALVNRLSKGDIVVTQDFGVAAMAIGRSAYAIHQRGKWYTDETIDQLLFERHVFKKGRRSSKNFRGKGPRKRTQGDDECFEESFQKLIRHVKGEQA